MKFQRNAYSWADVREIARKEGLLEATSLVLKPHSALELPLDLAHYGDMVILDALAATTDGAFGKAFVNLRLFHGGNRLIYPLGAEAPDLRGACQFFGRGLRDYRYRFIVPQHVEGASLCLWTKETELRLEQIDVCVTRDIPDIQTRDQGMKFVAHLGMIGLAPRNTLAAFSLARRAGYRECVTNTNGTRDGVLVSIHNDTIDETANGTGSVYDMTLAQLRQYDYGCKFHPLYAGESIPTLEETLSLMAHSGVRPVLRVSSNFKGEKAHYLRDMFALTQSLSLDGACTAKCFDREVLADLSKMAGNAYRYGLCCRDFTQEDCDWLKSLGDDVYFDVAHSTLTPKLVELARQNGIRVETWIINDFEKIIRLYGMGVSGFTTDFYNLDGCIF